jgi:transcriptional regulator with XRE-family HTH domain
MGKRTYKSTEDKFLRHIGERIQFYRTSKRHITQEQLAEKINSSATYISKVENGHAEGLSIQMLNSIAAALNASLDELLDIQSAPSSSHSNKRVERLLRKTLTLTDREQAIALRVIEAVLDQLVKPPASQ